MTKKIYTDRQYLAPVTKEKLKPELMTIPLIRDIFSEGMGFIWDNINLFNVEKGNYIFQSGDAAKHMYIVCRGHVKIYSTTMDGREQILYIYNSGDFVGGLNMLRGTSYLYHAQALEDCLIASLPKQDFDNHLLKSPVILRRILEKAFDRIRWAEDLVNRLTISSASTKSAALLLNLVNSFGVPTAEGIRLDLSMNREELGNFSGLTRETITRKLGEFKDLGWIEFIGNKVIIIKDLESIKEFCY